MASWLRRGATVGASTLAALVVAGGLAAPAHAAPAADACADDTTGPIIRGMQKHSVSIGVNPETMTFAVNAEDTCGIASWKVTVDHPEVGFTATSQNPTVTFALPSSNSLAGYYPAKIYVTDNSPQQNQAVIDARFHIQRRSTVVSIYNWMSGFSGPLSTGSLGILASPQHADWEMGRYQNGPFGRLFRVEHRAPESEAWVTVETVKNSNHNHGDVTTRQFGGQRNSLKGQWRIRFYGDDKDYHLSSTTTPIINIIH